MFSNLLGKYIPCQRFEVRIYEFINRWFENGGNIISNFIYNYIKNIEYT